VVQGSISILGAKLSASSPATSYPVYAPQSHSLPVITGLKSKKTRTTESIIYLKTHRPGIHRLPEICPFAEHLFNPPGNSIAVFPKDPSFHILFESSIPIARNTYPVSWQEAYHTVSQSGSPSILVCGQKGVGKSTFCQYLTNSLVRRKTVTYLETDPGQPGFTPSGLISLNRFTQPVLSPPFIRSGIYNLIRCQHIGNISPRDNPRHYIDCIADLLSHDEGNGPTIINTPGWTKGTGFELLTSLIEIAKPEFVVVMAPEGNDTLARSLHPFTSPCGSNILVIGAANIIPPVVPFTASELRTLGIMSYFHLTGVETWDFGTHLTEWKPWMVKYSGSRSERGVQAIAIQGEELYLEDILLAINATMAAIVIVKKTEDVEVVLTTEGLPVLMGRDSKYMDPKIARCVGYAIIRAVDVKKGTLMLLSPWDPSTLEEDEDVILERGRLNLPVWGMWDHNRPQKLGPYLKWE
jgi:polynucleotide 5'-hydroxyl-kinase GRC3/NOL9